MNIFPPIGIYQPWHIGDNVLIEPIARKFAELFSQKIYVLSKYPELYNEHPDIISTYLDARGCHADMRVIDLTASIASVGESNGRRYSLGGKMQRMWDKAGLQFELLKPKLYLSSAEKNQAINVKHLFDVPCAGIAITSRAKLKHYPYIMSVINGMQKAGCAVFLFSDALPRMYANMGTYNIINRPLREVMMYLSVMDVVIGPDTGLLHIAGALDRSIVPITRAFWEDIYDSYDKCHVIATPYSSRYALWSIPPSKPIKAAKEVLESSANTVVHKPIKYDKDNIALFRLDGLGGTVTLIDQAKKIYDITGNKVVLIVRGYGDAFNGVPYIKGVIEVGHVKWHECIADMREQFDTIAEIRFGLGLWHQNGKKIFEQDFEPMRGIFDRFPLDLMKLEIHGMHHILTTDMSLGLPYNAIEGEICNYAPVEVPLPECYLVVNNGVDVQHKGMKQTKCWDGWDDLHKLIDIDIVQVGTPHDAVIKGAIDFRGKTNMAQLFSILRDADAVLCGEGGIMHLAHFVGAKNTLVVRGPTRGKLFEYPNQTMIDSYICEPCCGDTADWYMNCPLSIDAVCMKSITPERVAFNITEVLNEDLVTAARI